MLCAEARGQTYKHRMHVIDTIPQLKIHRRLFLDLGVKGTSSDEEDPKNKGVYFIKQRNELSPQVNDLKRYDFWSAVSEF